MGRTFTRPAIPSSPPVISLPSLAPRKRSPINASRISSLVHSEMTSSLASSTHTRSSCHRIPSLSAQQPCHNCKESGA